MTFSFDLLTPKLTVFILVPKCTKAESLVKKCPILSQNVLTTFGMHRQSVRLNNNQKTQCLRPLRWWRHKNVNQTAYTKLNTDSTPTTSMVTLFVHNACAATKTFDAVGWATEGHTACKNFLLQNPLLENQEGPANPGFLENDP